ncbi:MAG: hypothetical protein R3C61_15265 [Bacteroidia bacterium]
MEAKLYKSVLKNLSLIPEAYLIEVNAYLENLRNRISHKEKNRLAILALAGSWSDMPESDFNDFLNEARESGNQLFGREVEL